MDLKQITHLAEFFRIRKEKGNDAAVKYAERVTRQHGGTVEKPDKEKPHLTAVK